MATKTVPAQVRFENILYATDFSGHSHSALPYVLSMARNYDSRVFVANIISLFPFSHTAPTQALQAMTAQAIREGKDAMKLLEPSLKGVRHETLIRKGDICGELAAIVEEKGIDLIVVGTHGRAGISKVLMGSVAEKITREAPCPVLTVGPNVCGEPDAIADLHTILCPIDFSLASLAAVPYAISLALQNRARLYLLYVAKGDANELPEEILKTRLDSLIPRGTTFSCEPRTFVELGEPSEKILNLGEELAVDLIVLGVKPRVLPIGPSTHLGMATAYQVIRKSICPVLTVRGRQ
jgi:nucleotide-binding universal stress UspA family protein